MSLSLDASVEVTVLEIARLILSESSMRERKDAILAELDISDVEADILLQRIEEYMSSHPQLGWGNLGDQDEN